MDRPHVLGIIDRNRTLRSSPIRTIGNFESAASKRIDVVPKRKTCTTRRKVTRYLAYVQVPPSDELGEILLATKSGNGRKVTNSFDKESERRK